MLTPFATVLLPSWGRIVPVLQAGADRWRVIAQRRPGDDTGGTARWVAADAVELSHLSPLPVAIDAHHPAGRGVRRAEAIEQMTPAWRHERKAAIRRALQMGWTVTAAGVELVWID